MIGYYEFGHIEINGKIYTNDVEVRSDGEVLEWWRKEGHRVYMEDIQRALKQDPEIIVIGTGESGRVEIETHVEEKLNEKDIKMVTDKTNEAVKAFNALYEKQARVIGLFHLTC